jgi:integrative and conjugative element protein (TIGR02256 family)
MNFFSVEGVAASPDGVRDGLARSFLEYVSDHGGHTVRIEGILGLPNGVALFVVDFSTCISQAPAYDVLPEERLAVAFFEEGPAVVPLRIDFPLISHAYGLPTQSVLPGRMSLCIDDRPWEDARADYNGAEVVRRILSWFHRADTGEVHDALQLPHPIFLPASQTFVMSQEVQREFCATSGPPVFLQLRPLGDGAKLFALERHGSAAASLPDRARAPATDDALKPARLRRFVGFTMGVRAENSGAMWHHPQYLGDLREALSGAEDDLLDVLRGRLEALIRDRSAPLEHLVEARLLMQFVVINATQDSFEPMFLVTANTLGDIGATLGLLDRGPTDARSSTDDDPSTSLVLATRDESGNMALAPAVGTDASDRTVPQYVPLLSPGAINPVEAGKTELIAANLSFSFEGEIASLYAGHGSEWRTSIGKKAVVLGVGSIGSQSIASLVREGAFEEVTIVDDDHLLPHNLARHTLRTPQIGFSKAQKVGKELEEIRPDLSVVTVREKLGLGTSSDTLLSALENSDIVLDMTASVGASRMLCQIQRGGRAVSAFFNPSGTSVVVLQEDEERDLDLTALEALYYAEVVRTPSLKDHLRPGDEAVVSGGQCRSVTSRIPSSRAAILAGLAASETTELLASPRASISVATLDGRGGLDMHRRVIDGGSQSIEADGWTIGITGSVATYLQDLRRNALPNETGGVLLGIVDHTRQRIEVALGLAAPPDSTGTRDEFERGVQGVIDSIDDARRRTMHQLSYVGEWHSHPEGARTTPSVIDAAQLVSLREELLSEDRPPVMVIVGDDEANPVSIERKRPSGH